MDKCRSCDGRGWSRSASGRCRDCRGTGELHVACPLCAEARAQRPRPAVIDCPTCRHSGRVPESVVRQLEARARSGRLQQAAQQLAVQWTSLLGGEGADIAARAFVHAVGMGSDAGPALRDALEAHFRRVHYRVADHLERSEVRALERSGVEVCELCGVRRREAAHAA